MAVRSSGGSRVDSIGSVPQVSGVTNPYDGPSTGNVAPDDSAVLVPIQPSVDVADVTPSTSAGLQQQGRDLQAALPAGSQVAVGGQLYSQVDAGIGIGDVSALAMAFVVLVFTFGALAAAGMPLDTAVVRVGVSVGMVFMARHHGEVHVPVVQPAGRVVPPVHAQVNVQVDPVGVV